MGKPLVDAVGDGAIVVERGKDLADAVQDGVDADDVEDGLLLAGEGGVGQVALERTANETPAGESFVRRAKCSRMAFSRSGGKAASLTQLRISAPAWARAFTSSVLRVARRALMRSVSRL